VSASQSYVLGHAERELRRLTVQARLIDPITRRFLAAAGLAPGMRVLDVGSGPGDLAFLAAEIVGNDGEVLGVERSSEAITMARGRAAQFGYDNVSFVLGEAADCAFDGSFDAIVGRYVLVFQRDAAALLSSLCKRLRPDGLMVFHEVDFAGERSYPPVRCYDRACAWVAEALRLARSDPRMGVRLLEIFVAAGLPEPRLRLEAVIAGGEQCADEVSFKVELVRTLLPEILQRDIATAEEVAIESLEERMQDEIARCRAVIVGRSEIGAWVRV